MDAGMRRLTVDEMSEAYASENKLACNESEIVLAREAFKDGWYAAISAKNPDLKALYNESGLQLPEEE
jgi:hypothetical protein